MTTQPALGGNKRLTGSLHRAVGGTSAQSEISSPVLFLHRSRTKQLLWDLLAAAYCFVFACAIAVALGGIVFIAYLKFVSGSL